MAFIILPGVGERCSGSQGVGGGGNGGGGGNSEGGGNGGGGGNSEGVSNHAGVIPLLTVGYAGPSYKNHSKAHKLMGVWEKGKLLPGNAPQSTPPPASSTIKLWMEPDGM